MLELAVIECAPRELMGHPGPLRSFSEMWSLGWVTCQLVWFEEKDDMSRSSVKFRRARCAMVASRGFDVLATVPEIPHDLIAAFGKQTNEQSRLPTIKATNTCYCAPRSPLCAGLIAAPVMLLV